MKNGKNIILKVIIVMMIMLGTPMMAKAQDEKNLGNMTEEECFETLVEFGLEVPEGYKDHPELEKFVKIVSNAVLSDPTRTSWYNFYDAQEFAMDIRSVILGNAELCNNANAIMLAASYSGLRYSSMVGTWRDAYLSYNCYAYAIGQESYNDENGQAIISPGYMIGVQYSGTDLYGMSIERMATLVQYDLKELGYTNITISKQAYGYTSGYNVIAIRKCSTDFHLMRMCSSTPVWQHKPGNTALLRYNYTSLASGKWTDEGIGNRNNYIQPTITYDSDIIYIRYKK